MLVNDPDLVEATLEAVGPAEEGVRFGSRIRLNRTFV